VGSGAQSLVTPGELQRASVVSSDEIDTATDAFGVAFRRLGSHGRVLFAAHVAIRQLRASVSTSKLARRQPF